MWPLLACNKRRECGLDNLEKPSTHKIRFRTILADPPWSAQQDGNWGARQH